jgi:hypothetical protein
MSFSQVVVFLLLLLVPLFQGISLDFEQCLPTLTDYQYIEVGSSCGGWAADPKYSSNQWGVTQPSCQSVPFSTPYPLSLTRAAWLQKATSVFRTLNVVIGGTYHVTFYTTLRQNLPAAPGSFQVLLGSTVVYDGLPSTFSWDKRTSESVVATSTTMNITMQTTTGPGISVWAYQDMGVVGFNLEVICPTGYFTSSTDASGCTQSLSQPTSRPTRQPTSVPTRHATVRTVSPSTSTPTSISRQSAPHSRGPHKGKRGSAVHTGKASSKKANAKTIDVNVDVDVRIDTHKQ